MRKGTIEGHMKEICPYNRKPTTKLEADKSIRYVNSENDSMRKGEDYKSEAQMKDSPNTPVLKTKVPLL